MHNKRNKKLRIIYFIRCNEYYKIGYTSNFERRLAQYRTHNPFDLIVIATKNTKSCGHYEDDIFKRYSSALHHGEWFKLRETDVVEIVDRWFR